MEMRFKNNFTAWRDLKNRFKKIFMGHWDGVSQRSSLGDIYYGPKAIATMTTSNKTSIKKITYICLRISRISEMCSIRLMALDVSLAEHVKAPVLKNTQN